MMLQGPSPITQVVLERDRQINLATIVAIASTAVVLLVSGTNDLRTLLAGSLLLALGIEWWALRGRTTPWPASEHVTRLVALASLGAVWSAGVNGYYWVIFAILLLFIRFTARGAVAGAAALLAASIAILELSGRADHFTLGRLLVVGAAIVAIAYLAARSVGRIEDSLDETAQLLRDTVTAISQGIVVIAPDGRVRYLNERAADLLALPPELRTAPLHARDIFLLQWQRGEISADLPHIRAFTPAMLNDWPALRRMLVPYHVRQLSDGRWLEVQTHETPSGDLVRTLTDVTRFQEARAKAQAASEVKTRFLANMSHELRTPMTAILGLSGLALESDLSERQREWVRKIDVAGRQLLTLVDGILEAAEPDTSPDLGSRPTFVVVAAVQSATVTAMREARAKGLAFTVDVAPDVPRELTGDGRQFAQLLRHLVSNAVKFTRDGGIDVRVRAEARGVRSARITVAVQDTGVGFAPEERDRIFDAFEQGDASSTRAFGGSGIGLALARRLAQRLGGELNVESALGAGSTFWFTAEFPLVQVDGAELFAAPPVEARVRAMPAVRIAATAADAAAGGPSRAESIDEPRRPSEAQARVVGLMRHLTEARAQLAETPHRLLLLATGVAGVVSIAVAFIYLVWLAFGGEGNVTGAELVMPTLLGLLMSVAAWRAHALGSGGMTERERLAWASSSVLLFSVSVLVNGLPSLIMMSAWIVSLYITVPLAAARLLSGMVLAIGALSVLTGAEPVPGQLLLRAFIAAGVVLVLMEAIVPVLARSIAAFGSASEALEVVSDELVAENQRLSATSAVAEETARTKSDVMANVSHEIRTPVNAILGLSQVMLQGELVPKQRERLRKIEDSGHHLLALVNHVLDLARLDAGKFTLELRPVSLRQLLEQVRDAVGVERSGKPVAFITEVAPDVPDLIMGDRLRLTQALLNYASNALKYTERGRIVVRVRRDDAPEGTVSGTSADAGALHLRFEVQDTGVGIGEREQTRLFLPFEQVQQAGRQRTGGAGLGLSIVRFLAERMDGTVGVESRPGVGSTFWFTARLGVATESRHGVRTADHVRIALLERRGARVLVVDDNDINREVAGSLLRNVGLEIREAESGARALALAAAESFDLVLMDLHMPGMDGLETTRRLRAEPRLADLPIVALTANALPDVRRRCLDAGMNDYLAKPFNLEELSGIVVRWVPVAARPQAAEAAPAPVAPEVAPAADADADAPTPPLPVARGLDAADGLRRFMGDHGLYLSLLARFVEAYGESVTEVAQALGRGDRADAELRIHTLKGVAATLGASALAQASARLEAAIRGDAAEALLEAALQDAHDLLDPLVEDLRGQVDPDLARGLDEDAAADDDASLDDLDALLLASDPEARDWASRHARTLEALAPTSRRSLLAALDRFDLGTALTELRAARSGSD